MCTSRLDLRHSGLPLALLLILAVGCSQGGPQRFRVSGAVAYGDKPVQLGRVVFEPDVTQGNDGPQGFAPIENGRFDTAGPHSRGVIGGPTLVRIDAFEMTGGEDAAASGRLLFPTHQEKMDLPRGDVTCDFVVPLGRNR